MLLDGEAKVVAAGRLEPAVSAEQRAQEPLVSPDREADRCSRQSVHAVEDDHLPPPSDRPCRGTARPLFGSA